MKSWMNRVLKWWMFRRVNPMDGVSMKMITVKSSNVIVLWADRSVNPYHVDQAVHQISRLNICRDVIVLSGPIEVGVIQTGGVSHG